MSADKHTYDSAYPAVSDVVSRPRDNIVLVYGNSSKDTYNALAFQVIRSVRRIERVESVTTLSANGGTQEFGYIGDNGISSATASPGRELFEIGERRAESLIEWGFAVPQDGVYVGVQTADGSTLDGLREGDSLGRGLDPDSLDTRGGVLSDATRIDTPAYTQDEPIPTTALAERDDQGLIRIDSDQDGPNPFFFGFKNVTGSQVTVDLTGYGMTYDMRPIEDEETARQMLAGNGYNRRVVQYGAFDNQSPSLPRDWYDYVVNVGPGELTPGV